jgi:hypothetical protein
MGRAGKSKGKSQKSKVKSQKDTVDDFSKGTTFDF